jgi:thiamine biosynthesis lipoprotein
MDTVVSLKVVTNKSSNEVNISMKMAFQAFKKVEEICSRFNPESEVMQLLNHIGEPVEVSDILFEAIRFAYEVAKLTKGIFDPTVGFALESDGFNRHYLTGNHMKSNLDLQTPVSYKDIVLNSENKSVLLKKPLILDLGAVAKGFAIDLAAKALSQFEGYLVDAGGDIYAGGLNEEDEFWSIGIRHPINTEDTSYTLKVSDMAVCTSGNYERVSPKDKNKQHIINPSTGKTAKKSISSTVLAPFAMMADAFSTAAFILGEKDAIKLLEEHEINGIIISQSLSSHMTNEMEDYLYEYK